MQNNVKETYEKIQMSIAIKKQLMSAYPERKEELEFEVGKLIQYLSILDEQLNKEIANDMNVSESLAADVVLK